jgi:hypothetical protein
MIGGDISTREASASYIIVICEERGAIPMSRSEFEASERRPGGIPERKVCERPPKNCLHKQCSRKRYSAVHKYATSKSLALEMTPRKFSLVTSDMLVLKLLVPARFVAFIDRDDASTIAMVTLVNVSAAFGTEATQDGAEHVGTWFRLEVRPAV